MFDPYLDEPEKRVGLEIVAPGLALELGENHLTVREASGTTVRQATVDPHVAIDREFIDVVRGRASATQVPYEEALRTHRVACALAESTTTGQPVDLDQDDRLSRASS
jgi:predicted dehydrogenase